MIPVTPADKIAASVPSPLTVMAFVIVKAPKPPGSRVEISPAAAVFEIAPAYVLHGAVRLQGLASSPTPDTQVRVACALAIELMPRVSTTSAKQLTKRRALLILRISLRG